MSHPTGMDAVIGLGSNLGDRREHLCAAVAALSQLGRLVSVSGIYETVPVAGPPQPSFLNAAVRLVTVQSPSGLLDSLHAIESSRGRVRLERWGPRTLDLDLLWARGLRLVGSGLTVPHPRLMDRAFAMIPLLDVAPDAVDPVDGVPYAERVAVLDQRGVCRVGSLEMCDLGRLAEPAGSADCIVPSEGC